ncbi:hypothetical protein [Lichenibacterium ramalinae]|uniref:Uncharacterized protein n=1 Tax=Lichenibacterium ramalinae TaxID=2316527 RepID=A0A4Q2REQ1_9HYPH|nr:hypothetical protein [Lichenibacterium ramalinae]RYB04679.1 hypothetical protein D3272_12085 [Lichenibacterium ramalinae]
MDERGAEADRTDARDADPSRPSGGASNGQRDPALPLRPAFPFGKNEPGLGGPTSPCLAAAIRAARVEVADRAQALGDLREAEIARLELLREMLEPVLAAVPPEVELFDAGLVPGDHPRLFIDMVAFVEMGRDRRTYRFVQDRRHARTVLHEGDGVTATVAAVTAYVARRLVEREQFLASLAHPEAPAPAPRRAGPGAPRPRPARRALRVASAGLRLVVDGFGLVTLGALAWLAFNQVFGRL